MDTKDISKRWINYFVNKHHKHFSSASLISDNPSLMFTIAGMTPFLPYFLGKKNNNFEPKIVTIQKCLRTLDIDNIGKTSRHITFFQMAGNFSFGKYFKKEAIKMAWELLTSPISKGGYGISCTKLWITIYKKDFEALEIWNKTVGIPKEHIILKNKNYNFWSLGTSGPAGPCSEIFYKKCNNKFHQHIQDKDSKNSFLDSDCYIEIINLVFMQYQIKKNNIGKSFTIVKDLPNKNIDTGLGIERLASILQNVNNVYETDQIAPILVKVLSYFKKVNFKNRHFNYSKSNIQMKSKIISDHVRAILMLCNDNLKPSNYGPGYVLRKLIRRSIISMMDIGLNLEKYDYLKQLIYVAKNSMINMYPTLDSNINNTLNILNIEQESFLNTLSFGRKKIKIAFSKSKNKKKLPGQYAFKLHDTYGFPIELTLKIATQMGIKVGEDKFNKLMLNQKYKSKIDFKNKKNNQLCKLPKLDLINIFNKNLTSVFSGYKNLSIKSNILALLKNNTLITKSFKDDIVYIVLKNTTFYPESGGQKSDIGYIYNNECKIQVIDVQKQNFNNLIIHKCKVLKGMIKVNDDVNVSVDKLNRYMASQAHTATHILYSILKKIDNKIIQKGSYNKPGYLRFDFNYSKTISKELLNDIESQANYIINSNSPINVKQISFSEAKRKNIIGLFEEQYKKAKKLRLITIGDNLSQELCGGTHVKETSNIVNISLISCYTIGSGIKRIESLVGIEAYKHSKNEKQTLYSLSKILNVKNEHLIEKVKFISSSLNKLKDEMRTLKNQELKVKIKNIISNKKKIGKFYFISHNIDINNDIKKDFSLGRLILSKLSIPCIVILKKYLINENKLILIIFTNKYARELNASSSILVKELIDTFSGKGGGNNSVAQYVGLLNKNKNFKNLKSFEDDILKYIKHLNI